MATLASVALNCAIQLGRANQAGTDIISLGPQIKAEIGESIRYYNRKGWHLTEVRDITLTTAADTAWYSTVDVSTGAGDQALAGRTSVDVNDVTEIDYFRENASSLTTGMDQISFQEFQMLNEGSAAGGAPISYTLYAGQIGIYPTPDQTYTLTFSGHVKPVIPTEDDDTSVWFDQAAELIEASACRRVCLKYIRDAQRAAEFAAIEQDAAGALHGENVFKTATGKITPHE